MISVFNDKTNIRCDERSIAHGRSFPYAIRSYGDSPFMANSRFPKKNGYSKKGPRGMNCKNGLRRLA